MDAPDLGLQDLFAIQGKIDDLLLPYKVDIILDHMIDDEALRQLVQRVGILFYQR